MTDKKIIINGVDVSGCDFYDKNKKYCLTLKMDTTGFKNPSCFSGDFQKCIQDSKTCPYTFCDNNPNCYYKQLKRKKQECEELKKANDGILTTIRILAKNNLRLRKIIAEIKEIAEIEIECKTYEIEHDCFNGTRCKALNEHIDFIKQILQKISEVVE